MTKKTENFIDNSETLEEMQINLPSYKPKLTDDGKAKIRVYESFWAGGKLDYQNANMRAPETMRYNDLIAVHVEHGIIARAKGFYKDNAYILLLDKGEEKYQEIDFSDGCEAMRVFRSIAEAEFLEKEALL